MNPYESLLVRVRQVRKRWRSQVLVKGISLFLVSAIALLILGVWGADLFGFKPAAVWAMRLLTGATVVFGAWYFLYVPLRSRISNVQIAQYIEENYTQLEDRLVTAVEYGAPDAKASGMIDLLIKDALDKTRHVHRTGRETQVAAHHADTMITVPGKIIEAGINPAEKTGRQQLEFKLLQRAAVELFCNFNLKALLAGCMDDGLGIFVGIGHLKLGLLPRIHKRGASET